MAAIFCINGSYINHIGICASVSKISTAQNRCVIMVAVLRCLHLRVILRHLAHYKLFLQVRLWSLKVIWLWMCLYFLFAVCRVDWDKRIAVTMATRTTASILVQGVGLLLSKYTHCCSLVLLWVGHGATCWCKCVPLVCSCFVLSYMLYTETFTFTFTV